MSDCSDVTIEHIFIEGPGAISMREPSADEARQRKEDAAVADALHTPEELQGGMHHGRADVRWRVVDRLVARGIKHPKTVPTLLDVLQHDSSPAVRATFAFALYPSSDDHRVLSALAQCALNDPDDEVCNNARMSLGHPRQDRPL